MSAAPPTDERDDEGIEREAAAWVLLLSEREFTSEEEARLTAWRRADPRRERIFASMGRTWRDLDLCDAPHAGPAAANDATPFPVLGRRSWRKGFVGAGLAAAAALVLAVFVPQWSAAPAQEHATQIAEIRQVSLADGSLVTLGADSRMRVRFAENERRVVLESGEAFFEIARDETRPFYVEAGDALVRVVGTKFNVNRGMGDRVRVEVLEGVVRVEENSLMTVVRARELRELRAGERVELLPSTPIALSSPLTPVVSAANTPGAWRDGRLDYNDARLGDLVADLNRYYAPGVRLERPELADLRVTASFRPDEAARILDVLDHALPIEISRSPAGRLTIRAAAEK